MKKVVLFGDGSVAKLAQFYLTHDSPHEVTAFTLDDADIKAATLRGLPVVPFEDIQTRYPPGEFSMFISVGYAQMNKVRESKYRAAKKLGYELVNYVSSKAVMWPGTSIGDNCFIMELTVIQPFATIGNNVMIWSGCHINHETVINDHCFLASQVTIAGFTTIEPNCFLGVHATIRNGINVARECVIGAGCLIMRDTQPREVYAGRRGNSCPFQAIGCHPRHWATWEPARYEPPQTIAGVVPANAHRRREMRVQFLRADDGRNIWVHLDPVQATTMPGHDSRSRAPIQRGAGRWKFRCPLPISTRATKPLSSRRFVQASSRWVHGLRASRNSWPGRRG